MTTTEFKTKQKIFSQMGTSDQKVNELSGKGGKMKPRIHRNTYRENPSSNIPEQKSNQSNTVNFDRLYKSMYYVND